MILWNFKGDKPRTEHVWYAWHPVVVYASDWMNSGDKKIIWLSSVLRSPCTYDNGWYYTEILK